jgi:hypothetical protein
VSPEWSATPTNVTLGGRIVRTGGAGNPALYLCYGDTDAGTSSTGDWARVMYLGDFWGSNAVFSANVEGLESAHTYVFRFYAANSSGYDWSEPLAATTCSTTSRVWTGASSNALASNPDNWSDGIAPTSGWDSVILGGSSGSNMTWDIAAPVLSWTQLDYAGTNTIMTKFPGRGGFSELRIVGDCAISNGLWTHPPNTGNTVEVDRLSVSVGGDFVLGSGAGINVSGRGYAPQRGPGAGNNQHRFYETGPGIAASHGGEGGAWWDPSIVAATYGSVTAPTNLGSGATSRGGGAVALAVEGSARIDGTIAAQGDMSSQCTAAAGGSIYLVAGALFGNGILDTSGGGAGSYWCGGGGRVAVILTNSDSFGNVKMRAYGGADVVDSAAGTVYRETMSQGRGRGTVSVDNSNIVANVQTVLPPGVDGAAPSWQTNSEMAFASLVVSNKAVVRLSDDLRMQDVLSLGTGTTLRLRNYNLYLRTNEHAIGAGTVVSNYGRIVWTNADVRHYLLALPGPHGTATTEKTGWYAMNATVDLSAAADDGYRFAFWSGAVPQSDTTNAAIVLTMDRFRTARAMFVSTNTRVRTWFGFANAAATNALNWYPPVVPGDGDAITLNAGCASNLSWDLNCRLSAWTQEPGYGGTVTT